MKLSIIIPAYQEEKTIASTLKALFIAIDKAQLEPEILIVDSSLNSDTSEEAMRIANETHHPLTVLRQTQQTFAGKARNIGSKAAQHELLAFIDAGVYLEEDWFIKVLGVYQKQHCEPVWGKITYDPKTGFERSYLRSFMRANYSRRDTNNFLITKSKYWEIGGLNETVHSGEDLEFFTKLDRLGLNEGYTDALAYYRHFPQNTKAILRKWISFTSDNVVIHQARAKFIFVGFELVTLLMVLMIGIVDLFSGMLALVIWLSHRLLFQMVVAKRPLKYLAEIPLTLYLILVFDLTRLCGLIKGLRRLLGKNRGNHR
jgi:glycosyltransferase involved in cell wall biosynthesis